MFTNDSFVSYGRRILSVTLAPALVLSGFDVEFDIMLSGEGGELGNDSVQ